MLSDKPLIILPTYNERENIPLLVQEIWTQIPQAHILVVDDNSPDGTGEVADQIAKKDSRLGVLHREKKEGYGKAYLHAFHHAFPLKPYRIVTMDCDFSHPPRHLPDMIKLSQHADLVLGCRYCSGGGVKGWGPHRHILSRGGNLYARLLLNIPYKDLTGGFRVWNPEFLERVCREEIFSSGYAFLIELTARAHRLGGKVKEFPYTFEERRSGASKMSGNIITEGLLNVWRIRSHLKRQIRNGVQGFNPVRH